MGKLWIFLTQVHSLAGPVMMLLYPLYASVVAMESTTKVDDEQWLAYWILYSFLTLMEMVLQSVLQWIPIWYDVKLIFVAWLVLPQFQGAAFLYDRFVRAQIRKYGYLRDKKYEFSSGKDQQQRSKSPPNVQGKNKSVQFVTPKKGEHDEAY